MDMIRSEERANAGGDDQYYFFKFLDNMPTKLSWQPPKRGLQLWVFWSQQQRHPTLSPCIPNSGPNNRTNDQGVQDSIRTALCAFNTPGYDDVLIQFWAPERIQDRCLLTTSHQPFALHHQYLKSGKLTRYKMHCLSTKFDGIPGRVFHNQLPELSRDVSYYSLEEYPQRDLALGCGITQSLVLPVFEPSVKLCIGVLELLRTTHTSHFLHDYVYLANIALKEAGLKTIDTEQICEQIQPRLGHVEEEIKEALKQLSKTHSLPLGCAWVRCAHSSIVGYGGSLNRNYKDSEVRCTGELVVSVPGMAVYNDRISHECCEASWFLPLRVGQGLVGNAFLSHRPCLCRDVTQFNISEYPLAHYARNFGLSGWFAIPLRSTHTGNLDIVLEFFLPRDNTYAGDPQTLLYSVLATMKRHFQSFEAAIGDLGNRCLIEVDEFSSNSDYELLKSCITIAAPVEYETLHNEGEVLQQTDVSLEKNSPVKQSKTDNQKSENSCPYEILKQHFGRKLEDAAESLGVSRSTIKRCAGIIISRDGHFQREEKLVFRLLF